MAYQLGDTLWATFRPRRADTLRVPFRAAIGRRLRFECCGVQDTGVYAGQAMFWEADGRDLPMAEMALGGLWVPEEDLAEIGEE